MFVRLEKNSCIIELLKPTEARIVRKDNAMKNTFIGPFVMIILTIRKNATAMAIEKIAPNKRVPSPDVNAEAKGNIKRVNINKKIVFILPSILNFIINN